MKVLFFVDIHNRKDKMEKIVEKAEKADLLVCAGDLSNAQQGFGEMIKILGEIGKKVLIIPGNNERPEFVNDAIEEYENIIMIHDNVYQDLNIRFLGVGGGTISPFNTMYELTEPEFERILNKYGDDITVLVSHTPPINTALDKTSSGIHIGSSAIRKWIEKNQPKYCCCGHLHENAGKEIYIGETKCFNPGPDGVIIEL